MFQVRDIEGQELLIKEEKNKGFLTWHYQGNMFVHVYRIIVRASCNADIPWQQKWNHS